MAKVDFDAEGEQSTGVSCAAMIAAPVETITTSS